MTAEREPRHVAPIADTRTEEVRPQPSERGNEREQHNGGVVEMARENVRAHLAPASGAATPDPIPFPSAVLWGAAGGMAIGAALGVIFGLLLVNGVVVVSGWEQLYSMTPGTFLVFWTGLGSAAGVLVVGIGSILMARPRPPHGRR